MADDLEKKVKEKEARAKFSNQFGIYAAALRAQTEKNTGAMICNGNPLITSPYGPIIPVKAAGMVLEEEARTGGNYELAAFLHQFRGVLGSKEAVQTYIQSYETGMKEKKLSDLVAMATSLGVDTKPYTNAEVSMYMDRTYEDLSKEVTSFEEKLVALQKEGKTGDAKETLKYFQLSATLRNLRQVIDKAYDQKLQSQAEKMNGKNYGKLTDHNNQDNLLGYITKNNLAISADKARDDAAKAAGLIED